jgi:hypothetical protein
LSATAPNSGAFLSVVFTKYIVYLTQSIGSVTNLKALYGTVALCIFATIISISFTPSI